MKVWLIGNTSNKHKELVVPTGIDTVCFTGGAAVNIRDTLINQREVASFLYWMNDLPIRNKIFCGGFSEGALEKDRIDEGEYSSIIFLEDDSININGKVIYATPYGEYQKFGSAYHENRYGLKVKFNKIPDKTDLLLTHIPPLGILDKREVSNTLFSCGGNKALRKVVYRIQPKVHAFSHVVDTNNMINSGSYKDALMKTIFINASCVTRESLLVSNGIIIDI